MGDFCPGILSYSRRQGSVREVLHLLVPEEEKASTRIHRVSILELVTSLRGRRYETTGEPDPASIHALAYVVYGICDSFLRVECVYPPNSFSSETIHTHIAYAHRREPGQTTVDIRLDGLRLCAGVLLPCTWSMLGRKKGGENRGYSVCLSQDHTRRQADE